MSCASSPFVGWYPIDDLPQGSDTSIQINYRVGDPLALVDLSTYTAKLQVRQNYSSPVLLELISADSTIELDSASPNIILNFIASKTENMTVFEDMIYDLEIVDASNITTRVLEGTFSISRQVTQ